ncbi:MAG TPA: tetratricopeptide repeat protein, partial [Casimicrobiaceae bacterium]
LMMELRTVVIRRSPASLAASLLLLLAAGLAVTWWMTGGPFSRAVQSTQGPSGSSAASDPTVATDRAVALMQNRLQQDPNYAEGYAQLGDGYLQKARETADPSYYSKADEVLHKALQLDANNFDAIVGLGSLSLSRHEFQEALQLGEQAQAINPYSADVYGVIGDAHTELGQYDEAVTVFQKMVDLRPDLSAYSRVSYARELHGDLDGALTAMLKSVKLGSPGTEAIAWTRVQVGNLYFNRGDYATAERYYQESLFDFKDYPHGYAGLAQVAAARGKYADSIKLYQRVTQVLPLPQYVIALGDVQQAAGKSKDAERTYELVGVENRLFQAANVDIDVETALFDVDHGQDMSNVLQLAEQGDQRRPSVKGDDVLAWTRFKTGDIAGAQAAMLRTLRLGSRDPLVLFHAGAIAYAAGDDSAARGYLESALSINPHFSVLYETTATRLLDQLRHEAGATSATSGVSK